MGRYMQLPGALLLAVALAACDDGGGNINVTPPDETDAGCLRAEEPVSYDIYFVVDVSGSMAPFLTSVRNELIAFAQGFPGENAEGRRVRVDYHLIGFVNDVKAFGGGRMTSLIAVQAAFDEAIAAGQTNYNLNTRTFNAETEENTLDALDAAIQVPSTADARVIIFAGDAEFFEAPASLAENIVVANTYAGIRQKLEDAQIRLHAFTKRGLHGFFVPYDQKPPLTDLPGSKVYALDELVGASDRVANTLFEIARDVACN